MSNLIDNRQIRIFISSTFRDMQDERDYLMKRTFPKLRMLAAERDVTLTELDLRWGITKEESESGKVVEICLREIENSIPFFIGIIGNRYGWVTEKEDLDGRVTERFPDVDRYIDQHLSVTEMEMQFGVLERKENMHAYFYIKEQEEDAENVDCQKMLNRLKGEVRKSIYPSSSYQSPEDLAVQVEDAFIKLLDSLFPKGNISELEKERICQRSFLNHLCQNYIKDENNFVALDAWLANEACRQFVVTGESGLGKSALIANWVKEKLSDYNRDYNIVYYFIGNGGSENTKGHITQFIANEIKSLYGWNGDSELDPQTKLEDLFLKVSEDNTKPLLIVIDAINQILDVENAKLLNWLPVPTKGIKILFSTLEEDRTMEVFRRRNYSIFTLQPLDIKRRIHLVRGYLKLYAKSLTEEQVESIVTDKQCTNTLVLRTFLDELVNFGIYEKLDERISYYLAPASIEDFYQALLASYENDFGKEFVSEMLSVIMLSKGGLTETEINGILNFGTSVDSPKTTPLQWSHFYCSFLRNFISRKGVITFSHQYVISAVQSRYSNEEYKTHLRRKIVDYCYKAKSTRVFSEVAYQLFCLKEYSELYNAISYLHVFYELYNSDRISLVNYWTGLLISDKGMYSPKIYITESPHSVPKRFLSTLLNELVVFIAKDLNSTLIALECIPTVFVAIASNYGKDSKEMAEVYNSIGGILYDAKRYKEALTYLEKSLEIKENLEQSNLSSTALTYNNMGYAYRKIGDLKKSEDFYMKSAKIRKKLFGEDSIQFADSCFAVGTLFIDCRKMDSAKKLLERSLKLYITHCGKWSERTADCYGNLGLLYRQLQDYDQSVAFHVKALDVRKQLYGPLHLKVARSYSNIGITYNFCGEYSKALEMLYKAKDIQITVQGENAAELVSTYNGIGSTFDSLKEYENAIVNYKKALDICKYNFGENSFGTAECMNNLAVSYLETNENEKALDCLQSVLKCWQKQYHPMHTRIGKFYINIGCALYKLQRKSESHKAFLKAYAILKRLGDDDEMVMLCRKYLSYQF